MTIKCPKCDSDNTDTARFCSNCATPLSSAEDAQPSFTKTLETPIEALTQGTLFADRYEIIEELGKGGMGKVYRALDIEVKEEVAVKLIKPEIAQDEATIERFRNELKIARKVSHRNVCRMHDLGKADEGYYITMECVAGDDLKSYVRRKEKLTKKETISLAQQLCDGLREAHELGVIHRDLKPQNIMIDEKGTAKIMDFGIARSVEAPGVTATGMIIGTPDYISPEQAEGQEADQRSDIYSLGVILYEMVTGTVPFKGDTALSVALKHKSQLPMDPRKLNPEISDDLSRLILICMEKDRGRRYQTAEALLDDLRNIEEGFPLGTKIRPRRETFVQTLRRKKLIIPALAAVLAIIAIAIWQLIPQKGTVFPPAAENSIAVVSFENLTKEEASDDYQKLIPSLLITSLEGTGLFQVMTWQRMRDLIVQMGEGDVEIISADLGFQACKRDGIGALVTGSYAKVGDTYVTDIKILDVESKRLLKSTSVRGRGVESILNSQIDELSKNISESLGISAQRLADVQAPIRELTTNSLEAYNYYIKAGEEYNGRNLESARRLYEKAVELDPTFAMAYYQLAKFYSGNQSVYIEFLEKAKELSYKATEKERLRIEAGYANAIEKNPDKRLKILEQMAEKFPEDKTVHLQLGFAYFAYNDDKKAIQEYKIALELDPNYGDAHNYIGGLYLSLGNFEKAIEHLQRYVTASKGIPNALDSLAYAYLQMGKHDEALAKYKEAVEIKPDFHIAYRVIAYILAMREDYQAVLAYLDQFISTGPSSGKIQEGYWQRAFYECWLGRYSDAFNDLAQAKKVAESAAPKDVGCLDLIELLRAWIFYDQGKFELGQECIEDLYDSKSPGSGSKLYAKYANAAKVQYNFYLGLVELKNGQTNAAKSKLTEMKSLMPEQIDQGFHWWSFSLSYVDILRGETALSEGDFQGAVNIYEKSTPVQNIGFGLLPSWSFPPYLFPFSKDVLARAYQKNGEIDKAIAEYERLVTYDPTDIELPLIHPRYHYRLAKLYELTGKQGKAIEHYEKFLELWKDADLGLAEVEDARERLAGLKGK